ncbi:MAG: hypothetical protein AB1505_29415 [Candidatus Latescibacterota bacterium]
MQIAGVLMDSVCGPVQAETEALHHLSGVLELDLGRLQTELLFLKAFAADFATSMALGQGPALQAILQGFYAHWQRIGQQVGEGVTEDLQERLGLYAEVIGEPDPRAAGLQDSVGRAFSRCCRQEREEPELVILGGAMFGALFAGISDLLEDVEVVLREADHP